jgi:hypothetical protein
MASNGPSNIEKYMLGNMRSPVKNNTQGIFSGLSALSPFKKSNTVSSNVSSSAGNGGIKRIIAYLLAILIVVFVILLFIHFFIKPIFRLRPGAPGIIPVPGGDDGKLFWSKTTPGQILNKDLPIAQQTYGYSINMDMFIENPLQFSSHPRILFNRGADFKDTPSGDTMLGILNNYNLVVGLLPDTNDLIVSVLNKDNNMENIVIPNIQVQEPFRIGIVVMEVALEVYINGHLMKTRSFAAPPKDVKGDIYPASGVELNIAKLRNLKIWSRILTTSEIRYATPSLSSTKDFGAGPMTSSSTCATSDSSRFDKLSVQTTSDSTSSLLS